MRTVQKIITILLIPCFLIFTIASAQAKPSTRYTPEKAESEPVLIEEPVEIAAPPKKGISGWWYVIGALLIVAAAAGGGGGSSSSTTNTSTTTTDGRGTIPVSW